MAKLWNGQRKTPIINATIIQIYKVLVLVKNEQLKKLTLQQTTFKTT